MEVAIRKVLPKDEQVSALYARCHRYGMEVLPVMLMGGGTRGTGALDLSRISAGGHWDGMEGGGRNAKQASPNVCLCCAVKPASPRERHHHRPIRPPPLSSLYALPTLLSIMHVW